MKSIVTCALLATLVLQAAAASASEQDTIGALQTLAVRIKQASVAGQGSAASADPAELQSALHRFDAAAQAEPDSTLARKFHAVSLLLNKLELQLAATGGGAKPAAPAPASTAVDRENLSAQRGAACANALGLSSTLPVQVTLTAAGQSGSDAWFRFEPERSIGYWFGTDSSGPDPALQISHDCGASTAVVAANDDALGLDAQVGIVAADRSPLFVHVTNSGGAGAVLLSATSADAIIAGVVSDAVSGQGIYSQITVYNSAGNWVYLSTQTDATGHYSIAISAGQYYVRADANQHVPEAYPNAQCSFGNSYYISACDQQNLQLVTANSGATTSGINLALGSGQRIAGTVRDQNNQAVAGAQVSLIDAYGNSAISVNSDQFGRYQLTTLPNGIYTLRATGSYYNSMYAAQLYNHVTCGGPLLQNCDITQATPVTVAGRDLIGLDFNLQQLATIHGTVTGPPGGTSNVYVVNAAGTTIGQSYVDSQGNYSAGPLPVGQYYVYAVSNGFFSQLYPGVSCDANCLTSLNAATAITITQQGQSPQANFTLPPLPVQHGHVQDAISSLPLAGVTVLASTFPPANLYIATSAVTDANGNYAMPGAPPGKYYLWAQSVDHIDQIYPGIVCEQPGGGYYYFQYACDVTGASLMTVTSSTTSLPDANFALQPSSSISGRVTVRAGPGMSIANGGVVQIYDATGLQAGSGNADTSGNYVVSDLAPGTYYAVANPQYSNSVGQIWQNIDCPSNCVATQGTPIVVAANTTVSGIDFSQIRLDAIVGQVTDDQNAPLAGVLIDVFDATSLNYITTTSTDGNGAYLVAANVGYSYFVATEAPGSYINQIYSGVTCPAGPAYLQQCAFAGATPVSLVYFAAQPHVANFTLSLPPNEIFSSKFE